MQSLSYTPSDSTKTEHRVLIVDDHPLVRQGIAQYINQEKDLVVCGQASDGHEALTLVEELQPDVVITDIQMKGLGGMDLVRNMRLQFPKIPVLMLSMHDESLYADRSLRAGAKGYLMKDEEPEKVVLAIRSILGGDVYVSDKAKAKILQGLANSKRPDMSSSIERLSDRELEVFRMIGKGNRTRHIADQLILSTKTVESYKARLKQKLMLKDAAELARYAFEWEKNQQ